MGQVAASSSRQAVRNPRSLLAMPAHKARRTVKRWRRRLPQPWSRVLATAAQLPLYVTRADVRRAVREEALIERIASGNGAARDTPLVGMSERVVEIPWVLARIPKDSARVLDTGTSYALDVYHRLLMRLPVQEIHLADLAPLELEGARFHQADVRALPFDSGEFDATLCISTLEHIGLDVSVYFDPSGQKHDGRDESGDLAALRELGRVTRPGGRVFVTVPCGSSRDLGSHRQYSPEDFAGLVEQAGLEIDELEYFSHDAERGWRKVSAAEVGRAEYGVDAPYAAGLICASLTPRARS